MIEIVSATRRSEQDFWENAALGISMRRLAADSRLACHITAENRTPLPLVYNARLDAVNDHAIAVFIHDDVWIDDFFIADRLLESFESYDIVGVAGNKRRIANQPAWAFSHVAERFVWDDRANLSGAVAHGEYPFGLVNVFGAAPADCELLDGVFLAAEKSRVNDRGVRFDPRFDFHFYDMDFCRSARQAGLKLGTWPICLTHQSNGAFGSPAWAANFATYLEKWGD